MQWIESLFAVHSAMQTVIVLSLICAVGLAFGKLRVGGVSLGVAFVFFVGILAGHLGLSVDGRMLDYAENFGLILFVYVLGMQVGPGFFASIMDDGLRLNGWGLGVVAAGTLLALVFAQLTPVSLPDMAGILCGATTNTPALGAAQQTLQQLGLPASGAALGCAVAYPLGVVGVIIGMVVLRKVLVRPSQLVSHVTHNEDETFIARYEVANPALRGKNLAQIKQMSHCEFIVSRIWRGHEVIVPKSATVLQMHDRLLVVTSKGEVEAIEILFGRRETEDWN